MWKCYLNYVDEMVLGGLFNSIHCSLQYLMNNTDRGTGRGPLLESKMELQSPHITFIPDLDQVLVNEHV